MPEEVDAASRQAFIDLVHDFYRAAGSELPYFEYNETTPIAFEAHVDDVAFSVEYDPSQNVEKLFVYCRFGAIPAHNTVAVLQQLLEVNLALGSQLRATLGIDAESKEVVYLFSEVVEDVDAQSLRSALVRVADEAKRWRQTYFLDAAAPGPDRPSGMWMGDELA